MTDNKNIETATFGNGCFWCTEAVSQQLEGVEKVTGGCSGGHVENPTYEQVCDKKTGHAGSLKIEYDKNKISFDELPEVFRATQNHSSQPYCYFVINQKWIN
jgi:peptide-methionine (S)-S-oxide reductase